MNERKQLWVILESVAICVLFASLWAMGGSKYFWGGQKWLRRFLAPSIFCLWAFLRSGFDWRYFLQMPLMMGAATLPYGADSLGVKWLLRILFGVGNGVASSVVNGWWKRWLLVGFSISLVITTSVVLGVYNPLSAMWEQFGIGFLIVFIPAMSVLRKV